MRGNLVRRTWSYDPALYAPPRYRRACHYDAFLPDPVAGMSLSIPGDVAAVISDAEAAIARLNAKGTPALAPLARLLLRTESIASSKVEGMQVDARTLARAEVAKDAGRKVGADVAEVIANIDAMQFAIERISAMRELRPSDLQGIHRVLLEQASNRGIAGRFRDKQNWIGGNDYNPCGADFVPPPPEEVVRLVEDLCEFCAPQNLPPVVQAAIAHAQFETIHPFEDGNGRSGRALIQLVLRRRGLAPSFVPPISIAFARNKTRYIEGLTMFRQDDISGWLEIFAAATVDAAMAASSYVDAVSALQETWREKLRRRPAPPRSDAAAWAIIDVLPAHPVLTVAVGVAATGRTKPAVNNAISELVDAGVLIPVSQSRRNRAWEGSRLLDLVVEMEGGRSPR
jgi:Fic family protein